MVWLNVSIFLIGSACWLLWALNTLCRCPARKSPLRPVSQGALF